MTPWLDPRREPAAPALVTAGEVVSRAELARRAGALAAWLARRGVRPGERVAALLAPGEAFARLLFAVDHLAAVLVPLGPRLAPPELERGLADARPRLLVHGDGALGVRAARAAAAAGIDADAFPDLGQGEPPPRAPRAADAALALLYTSGTSGRAKGALLTQRSLRASALASARHLGLRPGDRWLACVPCHHVAGLSIFLRAALDAQPVVVHERFDAAAASRALDEEEIAAVSLVPTMLARLLDARGERRAPATLRAVLVGGAAAAPSLLDRAARLGFPVAPTYGLTEASSQVATLRPGASDPAREGLEPLPGVELRIDAPAGQPGEILVRGAIVMGGYFRRPEATRRALRGGWLHTGDVGRLDARGRLLVLDRRSDLIVSGGENVYPAEVEAALLQHPDVQDAGVAGVPDPEFGARPAAWIVARPGCAPAPASLAAFCREHLAGFKVPVRFELVAELPRSASGKLARRSLPALDLARRPQAAGAAGQSGVGTTSVGIDSGA